MAKSWYEKSMPSVADVSPRLAEIGKLVKNCKGVKEVFVWGSYASKQDQPDFVLRDLDVIAVTKHLSDDLLAINDADTLWMKPEDLMMNGFEPDAVAFTRQFTAQRQFGIDHWAVSRDKKLVHWGAIYEAPDHHEELRVAAEDYASFITGVQRSRLKTASQEVKTNWSLMFDHHFNRMVADLPQGWTLSESKWKEVIPTAVKI